jgi:hypothetical protein
MSDRLPGEHSQPTLYEVLQVSPRADLEVIRAAYRVLARRCHPDLNGSKDTVRQMQCLNTAYAVLTDPQQRARYDAAQVRSTRPSYRERLKPSPATARPERWTESNLVAKRSPAPLAQVVIITTILVLVGCALLLVWLIAVELDERPPAFYRSAIERPALVISVRPPFRELRAYTAGPVLGRNRFSTGGERFLTVQPAEFRGYARTGPF